MRVQADAFGRSVGTLAATAEMESQTLLRVMVEIPVGLAGIAETEISRPALKIPVQVLNQVRTFISFSYLSMSFLRAFFEGNTFRYRRERPCRSRS